MVAERIGFIEKKVYIADCSIGLWCSRKTIELMSMLKLTPVGAENLKFLK